MIINKIAIGNSQEAFIEDRFTSGLNIISSDDNNKGKTIVMQAIFYAIGNEPVFPSSFDYKEYYYILDFTLDNGNNILCCRKNDSYVVKVNESLNLFDSTAELKRFFSRNGFEFPYIIKDNIKKMVDPVLLYELFFVGQDKKNTSDIIHKGYYKKEDFINMIYSIAGIELVQTLNVDEELTKKRIDELEEEKKQLKKQNKILSSKSTTMNTVSTYSDITSLESKFSEIKKIKDTIVECSKERNRLINRLLKNENALKELRSLNQFIESGTLRCSDCGSDKIFYYTEDKSYNFDITTTDMRTQILNSIEEKIEAYKDEIDKLNNVIEQSQTLLKELLKDRDISIESILLYKPDFINYVDADNRLVEIKKEIKTLKDSLIVGKTKSKYVQEQRNKLIEDIEQAMDSIYHIIESNGPNTFSIFTKKEETYSGCEGTEFYLSKLYALQKILNHTYPIVMDYFRDGELSTQKESVVIEEFKKLSNQVIFSATLKEQELGKYDNIEDVNHIDYISNIPFHLLQESFVQLFDELLKELNIKIK
ncbi:MAG: hypothetical protein IKC22_07010 [Bacilli bacterium]|nr:hypothetical protein [Bacilli bacterium]